MTAPGAGARIGVDLGGTKIEGIVLARDGTIVRRERLATPAGDYDSVIAAIVALVAGLERGFEAPLPTGIGTPGSLSPATGLLRNSNTLCLNGRPLRVDLARALGRDVRIANDADCMTLSEAADGAAKGCRSVFGVILGTGVGGGICVDGRPLAGANGIVGEWGHNALPLAAYQPLPEEEGHLPVAGRKCYCGRADCVETHLSGGALQRSYLESGGTRLPAEEIVRRARGGERTALAALRQYCNLLALALATVINILDPQAIVLAGGVSNVDELYAQVPAIWQRYIFADRVYTRLERALHGDSSGVRGAAWLWP